MSTHANMVKMTTATTGTGTITLGSASSGFQSFADAYGANATVDVLITDGTAWEVARNCTYTHSGTTLTRGTLEDSSTGSALNLTGSAVVSVVATAQLGNDIEAQKLTYICGLIVTKNSGGNTLDISAGKCYDPSSEKIISYAGATAVSAGTLGASQWNQVYIYDSSGTATIQVVNNASPPSIAYAGTARQGGTNSNRRWIGSFLTTSGSNIYAFDAKESAANQIEVLWLSSTGFRVVNGGSNVSSFGAGSVSLSGYVPKYAASALLTNLQLNYSSTAGTALNVQLSVDATNTSFQCETHVETTTSYPAIDSWVSLEASTPQIYYLMTVRSPGAGPLLYIDVLGYKVAR